MQKQLSEHDTIIFYSRLLVTVPAVAPAAGRGQQLQPVSMMGLVILLRFHPNKSNHADVHGWLPEVPGMRAMSHRMTTWRPACKPGVSSSSWWHSNVG